MVRPIDLQDNLSKTQAAERMNKIQKAHGEMGQRTVADLLKEKALADLERPHAADKSDMVIIRKEQEKNKGQEKESKNKKDDKEQPPEQAPEHLDLKA